MKDFLFRLLFGIIILIAIICFVTIFIVIPISFIYSLFGNTWIPTVGILAVLLMIIMASIKFIGDNMWLG